MTPDLCHLMSAKANFQILINVEKLRIAHSQKHGQAEKTESHKRHLTFLIECLQVFNYMDKANQLLHNRNSELSYENKNLRFEIERMKEKNKNLMQGL